MHKYHVDAQIVIRGIVYDCNFLIDGREIIQNWFEGIEDRE